MDVKTRRYYEAFYKKKFLLHWGGLADPFCNFEKSNRKGYKLLKALGEENYPTLFSFISEITHESIEGRTFGIIFTLQLGGGTTLLFIGGILSDLIGIWMPFFLLGIISLILSVFLILYYNKPYAINSFSI